MKFSSDCHVWSLDNRAIIKGIGPSPRVDYNIQIYCLFEYFVILSDSILCLQATKLLGRLLTGVESANRTYIIRISSKTDEVHGKEIGSSLTGVLMNFTSFNLHMLWRSAEIILI